jgi:hypothetical protein
MAPGLPKALKELELDTLHAARQACLTLLVDQHRIYLASSLPMMLGKLRDDVGGMLSMEPLGRSAKHSPRGIGEATDAELNAMTWAVDTLLERCIEAIDDPELVTGVAALRDQIRCEKAERASARASFPGGGSALAVRAAADPKPVEAQDVTGGVIGGSRGGDIVVVSVDPGRDSVVARVAAENAQLFADEAAAQALTDEQIEGIPLDGGPAPRAAIEAGPE